MVRCFVGYLLPEEAKEEIIELQARMERWPLVCKMVERENLHLNFCFLGEIEEKQVDEISKKIDTVSKEFEKFEIEIGGLVAIPSERYIRVLALDVYDDSGMLKAVFDEIKRNIGGKSKPGHITLCRVKRVDNKNEIIKKIEEVKGKYGKFILRSIQLIKSELGRAGPLYTVIYEAELA